LTLKILIPANQIPTTKIVLPRYQNNLCVISKEEAPEANNKLRSKILNIFNKSKLEKENKSIFTLFLISIGIERLRIKSK